MCARRQSQHDGMSSCVGFVRKRPPLFSWPLRLVLRTRLRSFQFRLSRTEEILAEVPMSNDEGAGSASAWLPRRPRTRKETRARLHHRECEPRAVWAGGKIGKAKNRFAPANAKSEVTR